MQKLAATASRIAFSMTGHPFLAQAAARDEIPGFLDASAGVGEEEGVPGVPPSLHRGPQVFLQDQRTRRAYRTLTSTSESRRA